ncbi:MAG: hypothetical protein ACKV22_14740 [Bryobacteraceae bacterium]
MAKDHESDRLTQLFETLAADLRIGKAADYTATNFTGRVGESAAIPARTTAGPGLPESGQSFGAPADGGSNALSQGLQLLGSLVPASPLSVVPAAATKTKADEGSFSGVWKALAGGFGLIPALTSIARLFRGGGSEPLPELVRYEAPPRLRLEAAGRWTGADNVELSGLTYNERGIPREASPTRNDQNITVQIQALDSRSFLDRSHDIARAVREAMLHMDPINDIVNDI